LRTLISTDRCQWDPPHRPARAPRYPSTALPRRASARRGQASCPAGERRAARAPPCLAEHRGDAGQRAAPPGEHRLRNARILPGHLATLARAAGLAADLAHAAEAGCVEHTRTFPRRPRDDARSAGGEAHASSLSRVIYTPAERRMM
jgi:hypothetical protein